MTVRYTAIDSMEEAALRDIDRNAERWRDKIEVRLDNRQVFFLFFGSAIVACMLFVLGVLVGKRIESRGQAASPELLDPLAALDRAQLPAASAAAVTPAPQLTFPNTLIAPSSAKPAKATKLATIAPPAPKPAIVVAPPKPAAVVAPSKPAPVAAPPKPIAASPALAPKAAPPKPIAMAPARPVAAAIVSESKPEPKAESKGELKKGKFTLHLSTFANAEEANAFAQHYPGAFVVAGDVPGRGMAYRVRYGNFPSYKDATSAKDAFEKQHNVIALIAAR